MVCYEKDNNDEYVAAHYDMTTMIRNVGNKGGFVLVTSTYFEWRMKVICIVANEFIPYGIIHNPHNADSTARCCIRSDFYLMRKKYLYATHQKMVAVHEGVLTKIQQSWQELYQATSIIERKRQCKYLFKPFGDFTDIKEESEK